ncbi:MAG TPA: hypothetical protein VGY91_13190 [Chthoniobacterales bacterium]|jgi:hypothetical protein|nr:hypothetical protein [Chthoniobacterales bacterium]
MTKRHVFLKALIASLPIAAQIYRRMPEDPAAETMTARIAACAAKLAEEVVTEWESQCCIWDELDADPENQMDPDYINSRRDLDNGNEGGQAN